MHLANKNVVVVGSGKGIGSAIISELISSKANILCVGRSNQAFLKKIKNGNSTNINFFQTDLTLDNEIEKFVPVHQTFNDLHGLVFNIGGVFKQDNKIEEINNWHRYFEINLFIIVKICETLLPLITSSKSSVIFISSIAGKEYLGAPTPYSAAKSSLDIYAKNLAKMYGKYGVRVNSICPGNILFKDGNWEKKLRADPDTIKSFIMDRVVYRHLEDLKVKLLSFYYMRIRFITGANIQVDGGQ